MRRLGTCMVVLLAVGCSCGDAMPGGTDGGDAGPPPDGTVGGDGAVDGGGPPGDAQIDAGTPGDGGTDASPPECAAAADCVAMRGPPPCGSWECTAGRCVVSCPGCTDADGDGYGAGAPGACAGPDCDDTDRAIADSGSRACYSGAAGTEGVGACRAGVELCTGGTWSGCSGEVVPGGEACNTQDDDCDGSVDEALGSFACGLGACAAMVAACTAGAVGTCTPGRPMPNDMVCNGVDDDCDGPIDEDCACARVAPSGNDAMAMADSNATPFRTIQAAIDWAAADATRPRNVCAAQGGACPMSTAYAGAVTMRNGISVYGRYESTAWTRCTTGGTTTLRPGTATGVLFDDTISSPTVLDGFRVERHNAATTAAITVDGATNVILSSLTIDNTPSVMNSYGIDLINGAQALITRSSIYAGNGTNESIGVRSVGSRPTIRNNCQSLDAFGHCDDFCGATNSGIRGRFTTGTGSTWAILLDRSPGAVVEASAICGNDADLGAGVRVMGDATGVVIRANLINAWGGAMDSHGVWLEDCGGAAPWIVDNHFIAAAGDSPATRVDGVRAIGDCHPVIDTNERITGGGEGGTTGANGVYCGANAAGVASRCAVLGNLRIEGSAFGFPPTAVGVRCDDGGCLRIERNIITGRGGIDTWGIYLGASGTFVNANVVGGGCATRTAIGIHTEGSFARIQNNFVHGYEQTACGPAGGAVARSIALHAVPGPGPSEIDVHSNTFVARGLPAAGSACTSIAIDLDASTGVAAGPQGVFRNNIARAADCPMRFVVREEAPTVDPRIFENNDLDPTGSPTALYVDEGAMPLTTIAAVNALPGFAANLSVDPAFVAYPMDLHIGPTSPCIGAGTAAGAPTTDIDGDPRDPAAPDVGADEG